MSIRLNAEDILVQKLLMHDLEAFSIKLGLVQKKRNELTTEDAVRLLNIAEMYSRDQTTNQIKEKCLLICGLIWEHRNPEWQALPSFLVRILSRLGLMPTTKMIDLDYDEQSDSFSGLGSLIDEIYVSSYFLQNEVSIGEAHELLLSNFQKQMWDAIDRYNRLGVSAATSAGKSFVLVAKIADLMIQGANKVVYIVPTLSLINQVSSDLRKTFKKYNVKNIQIHQTYSDKHINSSNKNIYVLTQERAASALNQSKNAFENLDLLIVDEVQNVERVSNEDDERAHTMYDTIMSFVNDVIPKKIIVSGPRIENLDSFVKSMFGDEAQSLSDELPPVVNITYSFSKNRNKLYINQYSTVKETPNRILIENIGVIDPKLFGQQQYTEKMITLLGDLIPKLEEEGSGTIIFSPTAQQAPNIALGLSEHLDQSEEKLLDLVRYIENSVHKNYSLAECVQKGVAYHHGKMPSHIRVVIEKAFSQLLFKTIVCTTTLMQGVNLPAKNIVARNPNLFTKKSNDNAKLTGYEFANLRGRAGRLMKDFVGRAIILDEATFEDADINLYEYPSKPVEVGYGDRFENNRIEMLEQLVTGVEATTATLDTDLLIYVRQMILKYGLEALPRMRRTGISISTNEYRDIKKHLDTLEIPKDICTRNWYWDPAVLNSIYQYNNHGYFKRMPKFPFDQGYVKDIVENIKKLRDFANYYFDKYLGLYGEKGDKRILSIILNAQKWSKEEPLNQILNWMVEPDSEDIDKMISTINKEVMYSVPKLLKPLVQMQDETNGLLSYMEMGAYRAETKRMIEIGVPRETAVTIALMLNYDGIEVVKNELVDDGLLLRYMKNISPKLNRWERIQIRDFIN
ncbi:DEAD/DEAH box helicase [Paenibacillus sp. FSL R5-0527]|uniref:DEAD/DEAH box helicase n=1 Tax=Paenibacillus TaxID=44249 RepID=UPI00097AACD0|nr:DEAD/DEAH box helicase [Paenibacillus macerans]MEC0329157.1 DEAD/DEAH box helicase [Paenibacillus macerans]OMG47230.1 hypothetical protein BK140_23060 [Paenibacillus macerans]